MGKVIADKYEIIKKLGEGGSANVYMAYDLNIETYWAIKVISKLKYDIDECYREVNILKELRHSGLPRVIDVIETEEEVYIVRDYVEGKNLREYVQERGTIFFDEVVDIIKKIIGILDYLHTRENPVIYRDLKPDNIIYDEKKNINLIDFGITRTYKEDNDSDTLYMGTKGYAAPELYGIAQSDCRTDIFALGATIYYLYTGDNMHKVHKNSLWRDFSRKEDLIIKKIIEKCVRFDPEYRYQNVKSILVDLEDDTSEHYNSSDAIISKLYIGIMGYKKAVGTTHISLSIAYAFAKLGYKINYINQSDSSSISRLQNYFEDDALNYENPKDVFTKNGIKYIKCTHITYLEALLMDCDICIVDFGNAHYKLGEFLKLQSKIFVMPSNSWAYDLQSDIVEKLQEIQSLNFMINLSDESSFKKISSWLGFKTHKRMLYMKYKSNPFVEDEYMQELVIKNFVGAEKKTILGKLFNWRKK